MTELAIRNAGILDAGLIADLSRQTFYETFAAVNTRSDMDKFMNEQFTREKLMAEVGDPQNIFLLAEEGENVLGYAKLRNGEKRVEFGDKSTIEIARIYAVQSAIGKGVGKLLMEACLQKAEEMKREIIWLGVWEKNERAISFYKKFGFEKFAEHDFLLGDDVQTDWLMFKNV